MLMIRLQRVGKKNTATFRVVLTQKTASAKRKYLEMLGSYDPRQKKLNLNAERVKYWLQKGAGLSVTCHNILVSQKVIEDKKIPKHTTVNPEAKEVSKKALSEIKAEVTKEPETSISDEVKSEEKVAEEAASPAA